VLLDKFGNDVIEAQNTFVQRSARETQEGRLRIGSINAMTFPTVPTTRDGTYSPPHVQHLLLRLSIVDTAGKEIHQPKPFGQSKAVLFLNVGGFIRIEEETRIVNGEGINIVRNVHLTAEPDQIIQLLHGVQQAAVHGTRPVKNKKETMVLTVRNNGHFLEQIVVELVGVEFSTI
jgi:hypothetical protein